VPPGSSAIPAMVATARTGATARVLQKLALRDRTQAVIAACESGLVQPGRPDA
jgi:hypothetical protein